jgi:glycosyltransferase involved in cell wall biosynthesis
MNKDSTKYSIAVLIPCHNEASTIGDVVRGFRSVLPHSSIYVYDNRSSDDTRARAKEASATVRAEGLPGKGNVVRRMFADIDADIYVLVDGDDTYSANDCANMINTLTTNNLDMVVASRLINFRENAFRSGHEYGNKVLSHFVSMLFGNHIDDMLSGFRVFTRRFVKSFPSLSSGFEIETELTIHALALRVPFQEVNSSYKSRPEGSESKLRTYYDGLRILLTILKLFKEERPLLFFLIISLILGMTSIALGVPVIMTYLETGLVPRFPTAILSTGIMLLAFLSLASGFILDSVTHGRRELRRLFYLSLPRFLNHCS